MRYINGEEFIKLGEDFYCSGEDIYLPIKTTIRSDIKIVYTHNQFLNDFFKYLNNYTNEIVIVSHNTDTNITPIDIPECVKKLYAQNVNYKHEKIESIPIGLENDRWFVSIRKKEKIINKVNSSKNIRNLAYMNFNISTNPDVRMEPLNALRDKKFITIQMSTNGCDFDRYIDNIYNHKFVICPEGHGIDTHRKWETLYLNSIPIEKRSINNSFYEDLPICLVDNWEEITEDFLNKEYDRIANIKWNLEKLDFDYWSKKIKNSI